MSGLNSVDQSVTQLKSSYAHEETYFLLSFQPLLISLSFLVRTGLRLKFHEGQLEELCISCSSLKMPEWWQEFGLLCKGGNASS